MNLIQLLQLYGKFFSFCNSLISIAILFMILQEILAFHWYLKQNIFGDLTFASRESSKNLLINIFSTSSRVIKFPLSQSYHDSWLKSSALINYIAPQYNKYLKIYHKINNKNL